MIYGGLLGVLKPIKICYTVDLHDFDCFYCSVLNLALDLEKPSL
jgi:hypothetical protein